VQQRRLQLTFTPERQRPQRLAPSDCEVNFFLNFFFFFDHSCILSGDPSLTFGECICIEELHIRGREGRTLV
jgi:hypothetical protein